MRQTYYVKLSSHTEGSRTFVFDEQSDEEAKSYAEYFAKDWGDDWWLAEWGVLHVNCVMELCTF